MGFLEIIGISLIYKEDLDERDIEKYYGETYALGCDERVIGVLNELNV